jgi:hypothetical protein
LEYEEKSLKVFDTKTDKELEVKEIEGKDGEPKWRIKTEKGYRYFTKKEIENSQLRKKIAETPIEILQKRNNVEATIFQLGYHYPNAKSRYRGQIKHQMWANVRCLWVNFVRIWKFVTKGSLKATKCVENLIILSLLRLIYEYQSLLEIVCQTKYTKVPKTQFSMR